MKRLDKRGRKKKEKVFLFPTSFNLFLLLSLKIDWQIRIDVSLGSSKGNQYMKFEAVIVQNIVPVFLMVFFCFMFFLFRSVAWYEVATCMVLTAK
jgi:hypothetical protein